MGNLFAHADKVMQTKQHGQEDLPILQLRVEGVSPARHACILPALSGSLKAAGFGDGRNRILFGLLVKLGFFV
jgi:hypothetical protein